MPLVTVKAFATVREALGTSRLELVAIDIDELLMVLKNDHGPAMSKLIDGYLSDNESLVILVNGRNPGHSSLRQHKLSAGDEIAIFPPVSGG